MNPSAVAIRPQITALLLLLLLFGQTGKPQEAAPDKYRPGLIVTDVDKDFPTEQAGLRPGDVLLSLDGVPLRFVSQMGPIRDRARWEGRKSVTAEIRRGVQNLTLNITVTPLRSVYTCSPLPAEAQRSYVEAVGLPQSQNVLRLAKLKAAAEAAEQAADLRAASWLWNLTYAEAPDGSAAEREAVNQTLRTSVAAGDPLLEAAYRNELGRIAS